MNNSSTLDEPFKFFKNFLSEELIKVWFFNKYINQFKNDSTIIEISKEQNNEFFIYWSDFENKHITETLQNALQKLFFKQINISIKLIDTNVLNLIKDSKSYNSLLNFYINELNDIEFSRKELFNKYEYLHKSIIDIQNHINKRYLKGSIREHIIIRDKNEKLIHEVFGYLNGVNENNNRIIENKYYSLLIEYLNLFIRTEEVPKFDKIIPKLNGVCNLTLRRTFYTFWLKLEQDDKYSRKKIVCFLKYGFEQLNKSTKKTIYDNLTKKPEYWKKFIPRIIKELP